MVQLARRNFGKSVRSMVYYSKEVPSKVTNYFDVFKLPQQLHPDLNHAASGSATLQGGNALDSSDVNHAYQVLLSPADRVRHLLTIAGGHEADNEDIIGNPEVCAEAFELRELIENIKSAGDIADALELEKNVQAKIDQLGHDIERNLKDSDLDNMKLSAARLVYLSKALDEIKSIDEDYEHMP